MDRPQPVTAAHLAAQDAMGAAELRELDAIAVAIGEDVARDRFFARVLAFNVSTFLIDLFDRHHFDDRFTADLALLRGLLACGPVGAENNPAECAERHLAADRLSSRFFARCAPRGAWPFELRVPFELAVMVRRALEPNARKLLPLMVREARWLVSQVTDPTLPDPPRELLQRVLDGVKKGAAGR